MRILMPVVLALSLAATAVMAAPTTPTKATQAPAPTAAANKNPVAMPAKTVADAGATATRCRDAKGHFIFCGTSAKKQTCRDPKGRFASCKH